MGWRFRKSIKLAPGIKINIGKKGISSLSVGPRGAHINAGKNGTSLSTGIPGTGLYNVTRLDKPAGRGMTQCPYCGHNMRKQWDACPKCHYPLIQKTAQQPAEPKNITPPPTDPPIIDAEYTEKKPQNLSDTKLGCGCLIIILIMIMMIGSCMSGAGHKSPPPSSSTSVTTSSSSGQESKAAVPVPIVKENKAATPAASPPPPTQKTEKKYYGNGPNGEGIKGHIDRKKGTKIYHIPGSTYYNRTRNVSQWFFTEKEAQSAGYRAPYR